MELLESRAMNANMPGLLWLPIILIQIVMIAWYVAVMVLLLRIWQKVKHLPG